MGGTIYMIISSACLVLETILQLCVVSTSTLGGHEGLYLALLAIIVAPIITVNIISAIKVIRTNDFSGKKCGRAICIGFHSVQFGLIWRSFKLLILFDFNDWSDYVSMRLFHCGFQSLPFSIILLYEMFLNESKAALSIVTVVFSLISASMAFVTYRAEKLLYIPDEEKEGVSPAKLPAGVALLTFSTFLVLLSRSLSIALFSVSEAYWIFIPLALHYIVHFFIECCKPSCKDKALFCRVTTALYVAFVSIFDIVGKGYSGVKCTHVLFYTVILVENLTFSFYWMLTENSSEQFELFLVLAMLLCFIVGLIVKFTSCGCIFNVQADILSDAFNNPELGGGKSKDKDPQPGTSNVNSAFPINRVYEIEDLNHDMLDANVSTLDGTADSEIDHGVSPRFQRAIRPRGEYINAGFVQSQGNISIHSRVTSGSNKQSLASNRQSRHSQQLSGGSKHSSDKQKTPKSKVKSKHGLINSGAELSDSFVIQTGEGSHILSDQPATPDVRKAEKPTIIVSDTSKHGTLTRAPQKEHSITKISNGNLTLASSHSKYSRNTNTLHGTLNGSVRKYGYNGFDDPYREAHGKSRTRNRHRRDNYYNHNYQKGFPGYMDCSLDSSELYPSLTSDSSSVSTYTDTNERIQRRKARQRMDNKIRRRPRSHDGYSSDISNSDYLSFNDYSAGDSSSWTSESSESSSDGAATWPPSHTADLLKMYNIPDKESSTDNILHWLGTMEHDVTDSDVSFSTLHEPSLASDTDISLSAMQTFEVKKEKKKFRKFMSKPKGLFLKFSSLNYKGKEKDIENRHYPLKKSKHDVETITNVANTGAEIECKTVPAISHTAVPLPGDIVQESIV